MCFLESARYMSPPSHSCVLLTHVLIFQNIFSAVSLGSMVSEWAVTLVTVIPSQLWWHFREKKIRCNIIYKSRLFELLFAFENTLTFFCYCCIYATEYSFYHSCWKQQKDERWAFYRGLLTVDLFIHKCGEFRISIPCSHSLRSEVLTWLFISHQ